MSAIETLNGGENQNVSKNTIESIKIKKGRNKMVGTSRRPRLEIRRAENEKVWRDCREIISKIGVCEIKSIIIVFICDILFFLLITPKVACWERWRPKRFALRILPK